MVGALHSALYIGDDHRRIAGNPILKTPSLDTDVFEHYSTGNRLVLICAWGCQVPLWVRICWMHHDAPIELFSKPVKPKGTKPVVDRSALFL